MPDTQAAPDTARHHLPTSEVPQLVLKCYHSEAVARASETVHMLIDPEPGISALLQAWRNDGWTDTLEPVPGLKGLRHIEIHDRNGVHRFLCRRPGFLMSDLGNCIRFDSRADHASVLPNPGVEEAIAEFEAQVQATAA